MNDDENYDSYIDIKFENNLDQLLSNKIEDQKYDDDLFDMTN